MDRKKRRIAQAGGIILLCALFAGIWACRPRSADGDGGASEAEEETKGMQQETDDETSADWEEAAATPFGAYPETVTYTLAKMTAEDNSNLPEGDTYEDNAYTRLVREILNVQNEDVFEENGDTYTNGIATMIASGDLADVMVVGEEYLYEMQKKGMLEDLTEAYENCASDRIREIYESYGDDIFDTATFDGRLMALPETNISNGPDLFWVRKDYLDELGLDEPETLEDAEEIARAFAEANIGGTEQEPNIGLACATRLMSGIGTGAEFSLELEFAAYGAYPQRWIRNADGTVSYGSVQPGVRDALLHLSELYADGTLDPDFLVRTDEDIADLIVSGRCGAFFAPWWAPNNPLWESREADPEADWQPYLLSNTEDGVTRYASQKKTGNYIVVRKGYEHPELVVKIVSVMFDYMRYSYDDPDGEFEQYYQQNVDPSARPLAVNVDYNQALAICYRNLCDALDGTKDEEDLEILERSYLKTCRQYLENEEGATAEAWSSYMSRITACSLLDQPTLETVSVFYPVNTETMDQCGSQLDDLEQETFLKIIRGEEPIETFDEFVEEWYAEGGSQIVEEVAKLND